MRLSLLLFLFLSLGVCSLEAQNRRNIPARRPAAPESNNSFLIGFAPISLITSSGKVNLRGEWVYADDKSLSVIVGIPRATRMLGFVENALVLDEDNTDENKYRSFGLIVENRFYLGSEAPNGFYLAPYARFNRFWLTRTTRDPETGYVTEFTGAVGGAGIGGSAGAQFRLGDHLTLDFTLAGIDFKWLSGTLKYRSNDPENDVVALRNKVADKLGEIPLIGPALADRVKIDGDEIKVRTPGWLLPAYRTNITINYRF